MRSLSLHLSLVCALCLPAAAAPILDGTLDAQYGSAVSVQTVNTGFGDNNNELNAAYARIEGGNLYLLFTGNLEDNFNNLNIFIDSVAGGQNVLLNDANNGGNNPANMGWAGKHAGFTFDTGFDADFLLTARNGNFGGDRFDLDFSIIGAGLLGFQTATDVFAGSLTGSNAAALANGIGVAFNNSNVGGVDGSNGGAANQAAAQAVTTGIELIIPLSVLGNPLGPIRVSAMLNGSNHDYLSNQFLGGLPAGTSNLGGDGNGGFNGTVGQINLNNWAGDQFFTIANRGGLEVPEPATLFLSGSALAALSLLRRRRAS